MSWKTDYQSMDDPPEEEQSFYWGNVPVKKKSNKAKLADIKKLALSFARQSKMLRQAQDIRKVQSRKENPKSLSALIFQVLSASNPMHIVDIIGKVEALGWKSESQYHKYSNVQRALRKNYYMFERAGIGTYQIRKAFRSDNKEPITKTERVGHPPLGITTMKDIVANVVEYYADHNDLTASDIHYIVLNTGVNCSYSAVRRALQDKRFKRNGKWFTLKFQRSQD